MKRAKRDDDDDEGPINGELRLPDFIIQDIQSFLTRKEAAQTTVLSKSWYRAWSTRPDINLDCGNVRRNAAEDPDALIPDPFPEHARRAMRRYDELNLKIETFRLRLCMGSDGLDHRSLAVELIAKAMKLGAKDMEIICMCATDKNEFILPHELLGYENLVRLSVSGCRIDRGADGKVNWPSLKFLGLGHASIEGDVLWDIMVRCPLIEKLLLSDCKFLSKYIINDVTRYLDFGHYGFGTQKIVDNSIVPYVFNHLTCLMLSYVKIDPSFFYGFSSKFPCMKDLTLSHCLSPKKVHISSSSLESITIDQNIMLRARIDALSLRKFTLSSGHIPTITFGTVSGEWESRVSSGFSKYLNNQWFRHFKKFLTVMSPSKLYLSLHITRSSQDHFDLALGNIPGPILEDLTINMSALAIDEFWNGLFWSCRPKFINASWTYMYDKGALEAACSRLTNFDDNCFSANKSRFGQSDLDEVNVEVFDETAPEWKPVAWKKLLDPSPRIKTIKKIRFHLKWNNC